jgi:hypothetical protein
MDNYEIRKMSELASVRRNNNEEKGFAEKSAERAGNTLRNSGRVANTAGKTMQVAGKGTEYAGKGMKTAGKGMDIAGSAMTNAGKSLSSSGYGSIIGVPLAAAGAGTKAGGKGMQAAGKGVETAGKGINKAGKTTSQIGKKMKSSGEKIRNFGDQLGAKKKLDKLRKSLPIVNPKQAIQTLSLAKQIDLFKDYPYIPALFAAILKDILDFTGIGSLPAIGTAVGICVSIFIFFMMLLAGSTASRKKSKAFMTGPMKRYVALLGGTIVEMLFGLNFFPIQTAILIYSYYLLLKERKENQGS